jgi:hypothetical protein
MGAPYLARLSRDVGYHFAPPARFPPHWQRTLRFAFPTSREKRARYGAPIDPWRGEIQKIVHTIFVSYQSSTGVADSQGSNDLRDPNRECISSEKERPVSSSRGDMQLRQEVLQLFQRAVLAYLITGDPEPGRRSLTRIFSGNRKPFEKPPSRRKERTAR